MRFWHFGPSLGYTSKANASQFLRAKNYIVGAGALKIEQLLHRVWWARHPSAQREGYFEHYNGGRGLSPLDR